MAAAIAVGAPVSGSRERDPAATPEQGWRSRTLRRFIGSVIVLLALVTCLRIAAPFAHDVLAGTAVSSAALPKTPARGLMLVLGLPHIVLGFFFMLTSQAMRGARAWLSIVAALAVGAGVSGLIALSGGPDAWSTLLVGICFLAHTFRDEWQFYAHDTRHSLPSGGVAWLMTSLACVCCMLGWTWLVLLAKPGHHLHLLTTQSELLEMNRGVLWLAGAVPVVALTVISASLAKRRSGLSLAALIRRDRSIWLVYASVLLVLAFTAWRDKLAWLVLLHVMAWWQFVTAQLASRPKHSVAISPLKWIRTTQPGFQTIHAICIAVSLALLFAYVRGPATSVPLGWFATENAFVYWTVMHVAVSVVPAVLRRYPGEPVRSQPR